MRWRLLVLLLSGCREPGAPLGVDAVDSDTEAGEVVSPEEASPDGGSHGAAGDSPTQREPVAGSNQAGAPGRAAACDAQPVTFDEVHSGRVRAGIPVSLAELSASSQKFLVSEAKSGSCLWGAFTADPEHSGAGSGLLLVSFGVPHAADEACRAGSDGLPDDLAVGDRLEVRGFPDDYVPASCADKAPAPQLRVDADCPVRRIGSAAAPEPTTIDAALADRLAAGQDRELLRAWSGALVQLESVSARQDPEDLDAVFPFGVIQLEQTALEVHSRLYYFDLSQGGPRDPGKAPALPYPTPFESVTGVVFLDYCTWTLGPRDPRADLTSGSVGSVQAPQP